jgi:hypothetical protein
MQVIFQSHDDLRTVSYAPQSLDDFDDDEDLPAVFRLSDPQGPDRFTSSSIVARQWVQDGLKFVRTEFANEMARPGVVDVDVFVHSSTGDRIYTLDADEIASLRATNSSWLYEGRAFGAFPSAELGTKPVYRFYNPKLQRQLYSYSRTPDAVRSGYRLRGIAWYSAEFQDSPAAREKGKPSGK